MIRDADRVILTPEHVLIRLKPAGLGSRFLAFVVDIVLILAVATVVEMLLAAILPHGLAIAANATFSFLLLWGYPIYFEVYRLGRSPGKRATGLRVVDGRGLPIGFQQSLVRNVVRALDMLPFLYGLGGLVCLLDRHHRRLGDLIADTLVIKESLPLEYGRQLARARRFNSLRTARVVRLIRHRIGLEEREFLLTLCIRAEKMEGKARFDLMETVGDTFRRKLEIDDPNLSGENLVRDLTSILYGDRVD